MILGYFKEESEHLGKHHGESAFVEESDNFRKLNK